ncbi:uncharacterized protein LOC112601596, partial [Melanaphis sacchari]|uniref:uncharacterized protein LOC112601596 n=1 Tax=Melanaphis sacchari TaxID=742174 RepID=UPI000DC146A0
SFVLVDEFARKIILCPRNDECRQVNRTVLQRIDGAHRSYTAIDTVVVDDSDEVANYPTEFLNTRTGWIATVQLDSESRFDRHVAEKSRFTEATLQRHEEDIVIPAKPLTSSGEDDLPVIM